jgi:hypothetical protein
MSQERLIKFVQDSNLKDELKKCLIDMYENVSLLNDYFIRTNCTKTYNNISSVRDSIMSVIFSL